MAMDSSKQVELGGKISMKSANNNQEILEEEDTIMDEFILCRERQEEFVGS